MKRQNLIFSMYILGPALWLDKYPVVELYEHPKTLYLYCICIFCRSGYRIKYNDNIVRIYILVVFAFSKRVHAPPTSGLTTLFTGFSNPFDHIHVLTFDDQPTGMGRW